MQAIKSLAKKVMYFFLPNYNMHQQNLISIMGIIRSFCTAIDKYHLKIS